MSSDVVAESYRLFIGRYSSPLAAELLAVADPGPGTRALDVGCGPGAMTARLPEAPFEVSTSAWAVVARAG